MKIVTQDQWYKDVEGWRRETLGKRVVEALKANWFDALYVPDREAASQYVLGYCAPGKTVAHGGSATLTRDMAIMDRIRATGATLIENFYGEPEEMFEKRRLQLLSDVYLCSVNAVTMEGYLVSVDGTGNRTSAMAFGPRKVIVVAGVNKICPDLASAWQRLEKVAGPMNMRRFNMPTPCVQTGYCMDCRADKRGCRIYTVLKRRPMLTDITVLIVGEELGY